MDISWEKVFQKRPVLDGINLEGYYRISSSELKELGEREPRLMAKQDTLESRPQIFKNNNLSILPVKNGEYVIFKDSKNKSYFKFNSEFDEIVKEIYNPTSDFEKIETLNINSLKGEFQAIDYANIISLLNEFTREPQLYLTIRGRLRSGNFKLQLPNSDTIIEVEGVQIEVDSGYEGENGLYLIEAKSTKRDDFHIRQLYYPWKEWSQKTKKPVIPIFFFYSNGIFYLTKFQFGENFDDIQILESRSFSINEDPILSANFDELLNSVEIEPFVSDFLPPFPQANDLDKIIDIITSFREDMILNTQVSELFEFDYRQGDYYANAAAYLGFLIRDSKSASSFIFTELGKEIRQCPNRRCRSRYLLIQLLKNPIFSSVIIMLRENGFEPNNIDINEIGRIINKYDCRYNHTTSLRRASTVKSWMKWICENIEFNLN